MESARNVSIITTVEVTESRGEASGIKKRSERKELLMRIDRVDEGDSRERQESYDEYEFGLVHITNDHLFFLCKRRHIRYQISTPTVNDDG